MIFYLLNGLGQGVIWGALALGLSLIFGMLEIINFAHGALYAVGAYLTFTLALSLGNFFLAIILAIIAMGIIGLVLDLVLIRRLNIGEHLKGILLTFGLALTIQETITTIWGSEAKPFPLPPSLSGLIHFDHFFYPKYRLLVLVTFLFLFIIIWLIIEKTKYGSIIRAGTEDIEMVTCLGIDVSQVFTLIFCLGVCLAGLAGAMSLPLGALKPFMGEHILSFTFAAVVIGGMGSLPGAFVGGLIIGIARSFIVAFWPPLSNVVVFVIMAIILLYRPQGLLGRR